MEFCFKCDSYMFFDGLYNFSVKSKPIISLFQTMKIQLWDFHCLGLLFSPLFYEFSAKSLAQKVKM